MVGDDVILAQEDIQFVNMAFPSIAILFYVHIIENDIHVIAPIIQPRDMSFLQRVVDCQGVKFEIL
jgi:hypothetical protein